MKEMKELNAEMELDQNEGRKPVVLYKQHVEAFGRLGSVIRISPKANVTLNKPGMTVKCDARSISLTIGIGEHTAELIMTEEAWKALKEGEKVSVMTTNEFKKKYK